uniref:RNase_Zc3h12a domain-containing protein n=1 Tax=Wuchereria bancrofti TaxID=6293 RepID=A0A1I8EWQ9_WUCBA
MYPFDRIREQIYVRPSEFAVPRLIVIDGCNIAHLDVVVFLPVIYNNSCNFNATNAQVLPKLQGLDVLTFTPARTARAGRPAFINYDDLYVLEFAERYGGSVLSGDRFDDIAKEYSYKDLRQIIRERRIDVIFRPLSSDFVHYGRDRFFRFLPELCVIHDDNGAWVADERIQQRLYCLPNDKDYDKVISRRERWTAERRDEIIYTIDALFDEIATKNCLIPKEPTDSVISVKCLSDDKLNLMHPEELIKRWLSPPASHSAVTKKEKRKQRKPQMISKNAVPLSPTSTKLTVIRSAPITYDAKCAKIINRLDQIFDRQLISKVLRENKTRDLYTIANLCAQQSH